MIEYDTQVIPVNWLAQCTLANKRSRHAIETQRLRRQATSLGVKVASAVLFVLLVVLEVLATAI